MRAFIPLKQLFEDPYYKSLSTLELSNIVNSGISLDDYEKLVGSTAWHKATNLYLFLHKRADSLEDVLLNLKSEIIYGAIPGL